MNIQQVNFDLMELERRYRSRELSPVDVAYEALRRIELANPSLRALTAVFSDGAIEAARASEKRWLSGSPLSMMDGSPIVLKSTLRMAGHQMDFGSYMPPPSADMMSESPVVTHLCSAGAVPLGISSSPEYAWNILTHSPRFGATYNPWDHLLGPGGSSGGTASAVAAGLAAVSPGTDAGGSVRLPAAWSGIVGFKPTHGIIALAPSGFSAIAHVGPMGRKVYDVACQFDIIKRYDSRDPFQVTTTKPTSLPNTLKGQRVIVVRFTGVQMPLTNHEGLDAALELLRAEGSELVDEVEFDLSIARDAWVLQYGAALGLISREWTDEERSLADPGLLSFAAQASSRSALDQLWASVVSRKLALDVNSLLERADFIVTDAVPGPPLAIHATAPDGFSGELWCDWAATGYLFNLTGHPAVSLPVRQVNGALPLSCQLVGGRMGDELLLAQARLLEAARGPVDYSIAQQAWARG